jgi:hypothetical protein
MRKLLLTLAAFALSGAAFAQTNIGTVSLEQLGTANDVDAVCTAADLDIRNLTAANDTVVCNAGTGTFAVSGPLTDTQLRATPVPVSGTVAANAGTDLNTSALLTTTAHDAALGTAGTADAQVRTVQGIASMTPILVDGSATTQPVSGTVTVTLPNEGQQTAANSISVTPDTDNDSIGAAGAAPPGEYNAIAGVTSGATGGFLGGIPVCTDNFPVNISTATTTLAITGVSGRHVYICSINLVTAAANGVALIAGTGATCGTSTAGLVGGTTGATGWQFAANGGLAQGTGLGSIISTVSVGATGDSVCIVTSAATQLSGAINFAIF